MLVVLTHEVLHDFYFFRDKNIKEVEKEINNIVRKVFERLKIDIKKQFNFLEEVYKKRFKNKWKFKYKNYI